MGNVGEDLSDHLAISNIHKYIFICLHIKMNKRLSETSPANGCVIRFDSFILFGSQYFSSHLSSRDGWGKRVSLISELIKENQILPFQD